MRQPTLRQWHFAALVASGALPLADCYRAAYGERNRRVEESAASRMARSPVVRWAVERIQAETEAASYLNRLKTRARASFVDTILREHARRAGKVSEPERVRRALREQQLFARREFAKAYLALARIKGSQTRFLTPEQRTAIVFAHYAPIALPEPVKVKTPPSEEVAELKAYVEERRREALPQPPAVEQPVEQSVEQQEQPHQEELRAPLLRVIEAAGHWEEHVIPGFYPRRRRRIWVAD